MMHTLRISFVEWPESLTPADANWLELKDVVISDPPDILVTNELPFGPWIAENPSFSKDVAERSVHAHEQGLEALRNLKIPAIISSRPVSNSNRLVNEAFVLEHGTVRPLHRKQYFPNEPGWYENEWYSGDGSGFQVAQVMGIRVGVLLCTDAMFNEHARAYGRQGADLIVIPRASGMDTEPWKLAGAMASLVSGAYVASSNRVGSAAGGTRFGGGGFAYAPGGQLLAVTSHDHPIHSFELDSRVAGKARSVYPCYVTERSTSR